MDNYNHSKSYINYLQDIRIDSVSPKAGAISPNENEGGSVEHDDKEPDGDSSMSEDKSKEKDSEKELIKEGDKGKEKEKEKENFEV